MFMTRLIRAALVIGLAKVVAIAAICGIAAGQTAYPPRPLPDEDHQILNEYLGDSVVGEALSPPLLVHGLSDLLPLDKSLSWKMLVTAGKAKGREQRGSARLLIRPDNVTGFRIDTGDGRNVLFGQVDKAGNFVCYASQDNQEGVISRFSPPQPIFLADLAPGDTRRITSNVSVADLSSPDVQSHSGQLNIDFTYIGAYRLHVPAGAFDSVLVKTHLTGKVGPAAVDDTIYRFFAKDSGLVAVVETNDISAFLIYQEQTRIGKVLVEAMTQEAL
jgi:hypothetical protein